MRANNMKACKEKMTADMKANQEEMKVAIRAGQEKMEATVSVIQYAKMEFKETITASEWGTSTLKFKIHNWT
jgi:hypothetical protein